MKKVVLLAGGMSKEREVSSMSADSVQKALVHLGYSVVRIDPGRDLALRLVEAAPDVVFNCLHGTLGEDGAVPGLLEVLGIPYTHSGIAASSIAMNKSLAKKLAEGCAVNSPPYLEFSVNALFDILEADGDPMPRPYVIKPLDQGSTLGVSLVLDSTSVKPLRRDWVFGKTVLVEKYIPGQELSVAVMNGEALGVLELRPKSNFYDYDAKYSDGMTHHVYPAAVPQSVYQEAMRAAALMHNIIGCRTISRSDFRYDPEAGSVSGLFFLEINTHPGLTKLSIVPDIAGHVGITFEELVQKLVLDARCDIILS